MSIKRGEAAALPSSAFYCGQAGAHGASSAAQSRGGRFGVRAFIGIRNSRDRRVVQKRP